MPSKSCNAVLAKSRAMYGKCLKDSDYRQLVECRSVPELASYLKTRTCYAKVLTGMIESEIHRGQLEPLLRQDIYNDIFALSRYSTDEAMAVADFVTAKLDIEQIVRCMMMLNLGRSEDFALSVPLSLDSYTAVSFKKLAAVRSFDDLMNALQHTGYDQVIQSFRPKEGEPLKIADIEIALNNKNYSMAMDAIAKMKNKTEQKELRDLFYAVFDFENLERILRLKKYHHFSAEIVRSMLIPFGRLSKKNMDDLCSAEDFNDVYELARDTYLGNMLSKLQYYDKTQISYALINVYCKHHLRLSPNPTIVMISYIYLKQIEVRNIINLIEATRYGLSQEEKTKLPVR